jgi:hypothetical protein
MHNDPSARRWGAAALAVAFAIGGCTPHVHTVQLLKTAGAPWTTTPRGEVPLEVVTRSTQVPDPVPVEGSDFVYAEVEEALGMAVGSATVPWAQAHRSQRPDGWQLLIELVEADVRYEEPRVMVNLTVRATLRTRYENAYLSQKYANCQQAAVVKPAEGATVLYSCMARIGRDLAGWLGGVEP